MEKKGDLLNQLAIITDLIEKVNINTQSSTIVFELSPNDFIETYQDIQKKYGRKTEIPKNTFTISIGLVDIIFNKSNV